MRRTLLAIAALAVLAGACRAEANVIVDIASDSSAAVTVEFGVDDELLDLINSFAGDGGIEDLGLIPEGAGEIEQRRVGDMTFYVATQTVEDANDLPDLLGDFDATDVDFERLVIDVEEDSGRFEAEVNVPSLNDAAAGLPIGGLTDDAISSSLVVRMPGTPDPEQTNANSIADDGTMVWDLPLDGGTFNVVAVTTSDSTSAIPWAILIGVIVLAAVIAIMLSLRRRQQRTATNAVSRIEAPPAPDPINPVRD